MRTRNIYALGARHPILSVFPLQSPDPLTNTVVVGSTQKTVQDSCRPALQSNSPDFNALIRSHMRIVYSSAPSTATYEIQASTVSNMGETHCVGSQSRRRLGFRLRRPYEVYVPAELPDEIAVMDSLSE